MLSQNMDGEVLFSVMVQVLVYRGEAPGEQEQRKVVGSGRGGTGAGTGLGGGGVGPAPRPALAGAERLARATRWGLAMRLGQRLSGGLAGPLQRCTLARDGDALTLRLDAADRPLYGEAVAKRHQALAQAIGARALLA